MKIEDEIRLVVARKVTELTEQIKELTNYKFASKDKYFKVSWFDNIYPGRPSDKFESKSLEGAVIWLSEQSHPMGFTGCYMSIGMYVNIADDEIRLKSYDAEKLARLKRDNK